MVDGLSNLANMHCTDRHVIWICNKSTNNVTEFRAEKLDMPGMSQLSICKLLGCLLRGE